MICDHPLKKRATLPTFGHTLCMRCKEDLTPAERLFTVRTGERTTFTQGDRVHVKAYGSNHSYKGTFQWANESPAHGLVFTICEKQVYKPEGSKLFVEGTAAIRHVPVEHVRHDAGVRTRRRREVETV